MQGGKRERGSKQPGRQAGRGRVQEGEAGREGVGMRDGRRYGVRNGKR